MAKNFKDSASKHTKNTKILIEFRTAAKYDSDFLRIEQYLWEECWRRNKGKPVIPDKEYNKWRYNIFLERDRIIGDKEEFYQMCEEGSERRAREKEKNNLQVTERRLQEAVSIPTTETS